MTTTNRGGRPRLDIDVRGLAKEYDLGASVAELAREVGVDRGTVRDRLLRAGVQLRDDRGAHWARRRTGELKS